MQSDSTIDMGCNCKATQQIIKIHKEYGYKIKAPFKERVKYTFSEALRMIMVVIIAILFFPFTLIALIVMTVSGKRNFNINNLLGVLLGKRKEW